MCRLGSLGRLLGVQFLLQDNAELLPQGSKLLEVLIVLALVLDLSLDAYRYVSVSCWVGQSGCMQLYGSIWL